MSTNHAAVAALPAVGAVDKLELRSVLVARNYYPLSPSENSTDLIAIDPSGGGTVPGLIQNGLLFALDDADSTTAHDGVTCLVSNDGKRYKLERGLHAPFYVLSKGLTAPPVSPTIGDAYLIYGSPTGAWAGHSGAVALYTARGWSFATVPVGFLLYVSDETAYYHRTIGGTWTLGTGSRTLGSLSVPLSAAINFGKRLIVENQTTNTPPVSPSTGDAYIIGSSPTGAWVGNSLKIAVCEDGSTFTIYTATNGWEAYDKSLNASYTFNGTSWLSSAGALVQRKSVSYNGTASLGNIPYDNTIPQITEGTEVISTTFTPRSTANTIRLFFRGFGTAGNNVRGIAAIFKNSQTDSIGAGSVFMAAGTGMELYAIAELNAGTTSAITFSVRCGTQAGASITMNGVLGAAGLSWLTIEEYTP